MKLLAASLLSAVLASWLTISLLSPSSAAVIAQEANSGQAGNGASPAELANPLVSRVFSREGLTPDETVNVAVYDAVNRSVVNITSKAARGERFLLMELEVEGAGSGAVIDRQGHIVTNNHVVRDSKAISVTLYNGESYEAAVVGADPLNDLAVIKIDAPAEELFPLTLGESRSLRVGMRVFAIGNPFGLERTLTTGIISSLDRTLKIRDGWSIRSIIQTDAAINPGSSGGPLLDCAWPADRYQHRDRHDDRAERRGRLRDPRQPGAAGDSSTSDSRAGNPAGYRDCQSLSNRQGTADRVHAIRESGRSRRTPRPNDHPRSSRSVHGRKN